MLYHLLARTLLPFLLVLILHILAIWLLLSPEKPQAKMQAPKVLLATLVASATPKNISRKTPQKTVKPKIVAKPALEPKPPTPVITKPKIETKPKPSVQTKTRTSIPEPEPEPEQKQTPEVIDTSISEKDKARAEHKEISDNSSDTPAQTNKSQDQVFTAIQVDARSTQNHPPVYPKLSKRLKEQGTVILSMLISSQGLIEDISIKESSGYSRLDKAALSAAAKWRYEPATVNGKAIAQTYLMPIEFKLNTSKR